MSEPVKAVPSRLAWIVAVFVVIIQQGAFLSTPLILRESSASALQDIRNPFNTAAIAISIVCIGIGCFPWIRQMWFLALNNKSSVLFMLIVIVSATWSVHPDLTIRRGIGYVLTMLVAAYLALRFDVLDRMKVLSASFAISAIGSVVFVAAFPQYGIMQDGDLAGAWRGVFTHKNSLGPIMAAAVFTELFILVVCKGRPRWRLALLSTYFALVVLSHSATALLLSLAFLAGTCVYLLWQRDRLMGVGVSILVALSLFAVLIVLWSEPKFALGIIAKDTSLSGRTALWSSVIPLIEKRPVLGWGYRAMWQANDASTGLIDQVAEWGAASSHNAFLEITLQLGLMGVGMMLVIIVIALGRSLQCCKTGILPLGWFSLMFVVGAIMAGLTMETLGQNQVIEWVVFNVLSFSCGIGLASRRETGLTIVHRRLVRPMRPVPR
ncbi:MAG: O-antigen ligase family protein [bacterium]